MTYEQGDRVRTGPSSVDDSVVVLLSAGGLHVKATVRIHVRGGQDPRLRPRAVVEQLLYRSAHERGAAVRQC
jgi:hypothetical protein